MLLLRRILFFLNRWMSSARYRGPRRFTRAGLAVLLPDQPTDVRLEFIPLKRGCIRFAGVTVARPDPLGLVKAFAELPLPQSLLVLPRRYPLPPVALPGQRKYQHPIEARDSRSSSLRV